MTFLSLAFMTMCSTDSAVFLQGATEVSQSHVSCPAHANADSCQFLAVVCPAPDAEATEMLLTIFFNKTGTSLPRKGRKTSGLSRSGCETAASQNADQNSHDSSATPSSPLCTL